MSCFAFKFLARGAVGPVSGFAWPQPKIGRPGSWIECAHPMRPCSSGIHACTAPELAHWLHEELWIVELDGQLLEGIDSMIAERGRLTKHVEAWSSGGAARFARAARDHAAELVTGAAPELQPLLLRYLADASAHLPRGSTALAAYFSAMTVARLVGGVRFDQAAYRRERTWQSNFIIKDLKLELPAN
jgi:hypothetical protein